MATAVKNLNLYEFRLNVTEAHASFWFGAKSRVVFLMAFDARPTQDLLVKHFKNVARYSDSHGHFMDALGELSAHWNEKNDDVVVAGVVIGSIKFIEYVDYYANKSARKKS